MIDFDATAIVRKLRRLMRNVRKGGRLFVSAYDMRRLAKAMEPHCQTPPRGLQIYVIDHRYIWLERRKK